MKCQVEFKREISTVHCIYRKAAHKIACRKKGGLPNILASGSLSHATELLTKLLNGYNIRFRVLK